MGQRRAMILTRAIARTLGLPALRLVAGGFAALDAVQSAGASNSEALAAVAVAVRRTLPDAEAEAILTTLTGDAVSALVLDIITGATVGGVVITDEASLDAAWPDPDPWAPYLLAWWIASEYRLFRSPGGS
jgi:hypothetical protein